MCIIKTESGALIFFCAFDGERLHIGALLSSLGIYKLEASLFSTRKEVGCFAGALHVMAIWLQIRQEWISQELEADSFMRKVEILEADS